jgi:hypothetical protein
LSHHAHQLDRALETVLAGAGESGMAAALDGFDRAAYPIHQVHQRDAVGKREILDEAALSALAAAAA